jgi:hypothetical protein
MARSTGVKTRQLGEARREIEAQQGCSPNYPQKRVIYLEFMSN